MNFELTIKALTAIEAAKNTPDFIKQFEVWMG